MMRGVDHRSVHASPLFAHLYEAGRVVIGTRRPPPLPPLPPLPPPLTPLPPPRYEVLCGISLTINRRRCHCQYTVVRTYYLFRGAVVCTAGAIILSRPAVWIRPLRSRRCPSESPAHSYIKGGRKHPTGAIFDAALLLFFCLSLIIVPCLLTSPKDGKVIRFYVLPKELLLLLSLSL